MKSDLINHSNKIQWSLRFFLLLMIIGVFLSSNLYAKTAKEIDASVDVSIERFYKQVQGASELAQRAKGMLVMPNVVKA
ncbi:MAG: hypothetical protein JRF29_10015, partial [Deltaproteobacteria bacterium]|nr:hypothetical protein [Deltaproteobacteria bacterium]